MAGAHVAHRARRSGKSHLAAIWAEEPARASVGAGIARRALPTALATGALVLEDFARAHSTSARCFIFSISAQQEGLTAPDRARRAGGLGRRAADLASRLRAIPVVALSAPDDALLRAVMVKLFADRQLAVDENLIAYLVSAHGARFPAARDGGATGSTAKRCGRNARSIARWPRSFIAILER